MSHFQTFLFFAILCASPSFQIINHFTKCKFHLPCFNFPIITSHKQLLVAEHFNFFASSMSYAPTYINFFEKASLLQCAYLNGERRRPAFRTSISLRDSLLFENRRVSFRTMNPVHQEYPQKFKGLACQMQDVDRPDRSELDHRPTVCRLQSLGHFAAVIHLLVNVGIQVSGER